jgi:hypothetical protein
VECISQKGTSPYYYPSEAVIRFDFPARGDMPPVKIFWHDAMMKQPDVQGVPPGEILGDLPRNRVRHPEEGLKPQERQTIGGVFTDAFFSPAPETPPPPPRAEAAPGDANAKMEAEISRRIAQGSNGSLFIGDKGMITTGTYGEWTRLIPVEKMRDYRFPPEFLTRSPGHYRDWIRACKGGEPACSNFSVSAPFTEWVTLGVLALRFPGKLEWDSEKLRVTNNSDADKLLKPTFRSGWHLS